VHLSFFPLSFIILNYYLKRIWLTLSYWIGILVFGNASWRLTGTGARCNLLFFSPSIPSSLKSLDDISVILQFNVFVDNKNVIKYLNISEMNLKDSLISKVIVFHNLDKSGLCLFVVFFFKLTKWTLLQSSQDIRAYSNFLYLCNQINFF
jgi:hypothetical protein